VAIVLFEGPDGAGKTTIAQEYARKYGSPYFKNVLEHNQKAQNETALLTKYAGRFSAQLLRTLNVHGGGIDLVIDRHYPSEWVYSQVEGRETDLDILRSIDNTFADAGQFYIVICIKEEMDYVIKEDGHADADKLKKLHRKYKEFTLWTSIKNILLLDTSSEMTGMHVQRVGQFVRSSF
jgi:thymidylate kinase